MIIYALCPSVGLSLHGVMAQWAASKYSYFDIKFIMMARFFGAGETSWEHGNLSICMSTPLGSSVRDTKMLSYSAKP